MIVKELIATLSKLPENARIGTVGTDRYGYWVETNDVKVHILGKDAANNYRPWKENDVIISGLDLG